MQLFYVIDAIIISRKRHYSYLYHTFYNLEIFLAVEKALGNFYVELNVNVKQRMQFF